jgi:AcrR family transcriptional regulator
MPQVQKAEVRDRIQAAALEVFAERGFRGATMPEIATRAGVAAANIYRYYENKEALFAAVIPDHLADEHRVLLERSVRSVAFLATGPVKATATTDMQAILEFWLAHRHAVVVLLDRAEDTPFEGYGDRFVEKLVALSVAELRAAHPGIRISRVVRQVLTAVFDNTRRALASILSSTDDEATLREAVTAFRSYQMGGLSALSAFIARSGT